jgi:hypothetical protein
MKHCVMSMGLVGVCVALACSSESTGTGSFDGSKTLQKKLFVPMGGVNSGPMNFGWAAIPNSAAAPSTTA